MKRFVCDSEPSGDYLTVRRQVLHLETGYFADILLQRQWAVSSGKN